MVSSKEVPDFFESFQRRNTTTVEPVGDSVRGDSIEPSQFVNGDSLLGHLGSDYLDQFSVGLEQHILVILDVLFRMAKKRHRCVLHTFIAPLAIAW